MFSISVGLTCLVRFLKSIMDFSDDKHMTKIKILDGDISRLLEVCTIGLQMETATQATNIHKLLISLNEPIKRLTDQPTSSAQVSQEGVRLEILRCLSPVPYSSHHKWYSESKVFGSCQWLLEHDCYRDWWNSSSSSVFLLHGCLGAGKSTLASAVVDFFLDNKSERESAPVAYFYCSKNPAESERSDPDEIIRSILRQLTCKSGLVPTIDERILREFEYQRANARKDGFELERLETAECVRIILNIATVSPVIIVLDAVDEDPSKSRHVLLSGIMRIIRDSLSMVKIFITSRDDNNVQLLLPDAFAFRVEKKYIKKDMDDFVHRELSLAI